MPRPLLTFSVLASAALLLAGCATASGTPVPSSTNTIPIDNCGVEVPVAAPPQRVIAIKQDGKGETQARILEGHAERG